MSEIEKLRLLKKKFSSSNLNESDTRFQIIDEIITSVLGWPKETITTEKYIEGNRADYVLKDANDKSLLFVESKKSEFYFNLPKGFNSDKLVEKVQMEKLLTDKNIKSAVNQVREYAEDLMCNYACVCNGKFGFFLE